MFGLFGVVYVGIVYEGLSLIVLALRTLLTLLHMAYFAVWCSVHNGGKAVCNHPWIRPFWNSQPLPVHVIKPKGLSIAEDVAWRKEHMK